MSTAEGALVTLVQSNVSWYLRQKSLFVGVTTSPLAAFAVGQLAKIYDTAAKSSSSFLPFFNRPDTASLNHARVTPEAIPLNSSDTATALLKQLMLEEAGLYPVLVKALVDVMELGTKGDRGYLHYGVQMMGRLIPHYILESEVAKKMRAALEKPKGNCKPDGNEPVECKRLLLDAVQLLWQAAHEKIAYETSTSAPSNLIHSTIENTQLLHGSLFAQISVVSGLLTNMANSLTDEAKELAKIITETSEQTLSTVAEVVKGAQTQITAIIVPQSLTDFVKASAEGVELFSEYIWTSQPSVWGFSYGLPELNQVILDDDDLNFLLVNQQSHIRRPILCAGER